MATESESSSSSERVTLRRKAIGLPGVLFQLITTMAPASAVAFSLGAALLFTGGTLPLAVLIALIVCSLIALNIGALARYLPSAGGLFTYVSHGLGVQAGWMTGWLFSLCAGSLRHPFSKSVVFYERMSQGASTGGPSRSNSYLTFRGSCKGGCLLLRVRQQHLDRRDLHLGHPFAKSVVFYERMSQGASTGRQCVVVY